ncbi:MAG: hypothetical protein ACHQHN_04290 [Sphingobacteriales bacterium]
MRFVLFFISLFVTVGCLLGAPVNNPWPNFGAIMVLWFIFTSLPCQGADAWKNSASALISVTTTNITDYLPPPAILLHNFVT